MLISPFEWHQYYEKLNESSKIDIFKQVYETKQTIITIIPNQFFLPRSQLIYYIQDEISSNARIQKLIHVICKNRLNHFSLLQLKAFNKVLKFYKYGTRYKITTRDWRLLRYLFWLLMELKFFYPELHMLGYNTS